MDSERALKAKRSVMTINPYPEISVDASESWIDADGLHQEATPDATEDSEGSDISEVSHDYDVLSRSAHDTAPNQFTNIDDEREPPSKPLMSSRSIGNSNSVLRQRQQKQTAKSRPVQAGSLASPAQGRKQRDSPDLLMPSIDDVSSMSYHHIQTHSNNVSRQQKKKIYEAPRKRGGPKTETASSPSFLDRFQAGFAELMGELGSIAIMSIRNLKKPISYFFSIGLVFIVVWTAWAVIKGSFRDNVIRGTCSIPAAQWIMPTLCEPYATVYRGTVAPMADFDRLMASNQHFEEILASRAEAVALPAAMKRSEASIRDLRLLVSVSTLKSRGQLTLEFDNYIETSRVALRDLTVFNSHVDRSADFILVMARHTRHVLNDIEAERLLNPGGGGENGGGGGLKGALLVALGLSSRTPTASQRVLAQYKEHAERVEEHIHQLLLEAEALFMVLQRLDDRLDVIGEIAGREDNVASARRQEVLAQLWTKLGGNRSRLDKFNYELAILQQVGLQRRTAMASVGDAIVQLREMEAELAGLRDRVAAVRLLEDDDDDGSHRGQSHRRGHVSIGMHLENVENGVRRLEASRDQSRRKFDDFQEKAWSGAMGALESEGNRRRIESD